MKRGTKPIPREGSDGRLKAKAGGCRWPDGGRERGRVAKRTQMLVDRVKGEVRNEPIAWPVAGRFPRQYHVNGDAGADAETPGELSAGLRCSCGGVTDRRIFGRAKRHLWIEDWQNMRCGRPGLGAKLLGLFAVRVGRPMDRRAPSMI